MIWTLQSDRWLLKPHVKYRLVGKVTFTTFKMKFQFNHFLIDCDRETVFAEVKPGSESPHPHHLSITNSLKNLHNPLFIYRLDLPHQQKYQHHYALGLYSFR